MACARGYGQPLHSHQSPTSSIKTEKSSKRSTVSDESDDSPSHQPVRGYRFKMSPKADSPMLYRDVTPQEEIPQIIKQENLPPLCPQDEKFYTIRKKPSEFYNSYDWFVKLTDDKFYAAPVSCFHHAPGYDVWSNIDVGMKVEVENLDCDNGQPFAGLMATSFWVGTVMKICGYKAKIRYEGYENDGSHDFWVNLCSSEVHSVGWCATRGKHLIPPKSIDLKYRDWKELLVNNLSGARTIPSTFYSKINDSMKSRFRCGLNLEVVDKNRISQVKVATVHKIVGKRLFVKYFDSSPDDNGFWCHEDSPLIHPVGWAATVGHRLDAPHDYLERMSGMLNFYYYILHLYTYLD